MIDPDEFWDGARKRWHESVMSKRFPLWLMNKPSREILRLAAQCLPAQIIAEIDEFGGRMFQLHPDPEKASAKTWVWLMRVRYGWRDRLFQDFFGTKGHSFFVDEVAKADADFGHAAMMESLCGEDVCDVAAFAVDFSRCYGTLNGCATVIGYPQWPELEESRPVRLFRTVKGWWDSGCRGAALIGDEFECTMWLHGCGGGIITDDVAHGKHIQKILIRPYTGPKVLVAQ